VKGRQLTAGERDEARHLLQVLFENVRVVRNAIEPQTGVLGLSVGQWRTQWAHLRCDLDSFTERVSAGYKADGAEPDREKLAKMLREIHGIASVPRTLTGKMAHITELAGLALAELGEDDPNEWHPDKDET